MLKKTALILTVALLCGFNFFYSLGRAPVEDWDEARHGVSAYEMNMSGDYLVHTYLGGKDMWNLKPPLGFWPIALSFKALGADAFSLRLPSAVFACITVAAVMLIGYLTGGFLTAFLSGLILSTAHGYLFQHAVRTGNFDSMYTMILTLNILFLLLSLKNKKWLIAAGLSTGLGFLVKSFAASHGIIITLVFIAMNLKKQKYTFADIALLALSSAAPVAGWALARYGRDGAEFFAKMLSYDLAERASKPIEGYYGGWFFYLKFIGKMGPWAALLASLVFIWKYRALNDSSKLALAWLAVVFLVPTFVKTKNIWYVHPVYPAAAVLCAYGCSVFYENAVKTKKSAAVFGAVIVLLLIASEIRVVYRINKEAKYENRTHEALLALGAAPERGKTLIYADKFLNQSDYFILTAVSGYSVRQPERFERVPKGALLLVRPRGAGYVSGYVKTAENPYFTAFIKK